LVNVPDRCETPIIGGCRRSELAREFGLLEPGARIRSITRHDRDVGVIDGLGDLSQLSLNAAELRCLTNSKAKGICRSTWYMPVIAQTTPSR
jgi:hypothetical protein